MPNLKYSINPKLILIEIALAWKYWNNPLTF